MNKENARSKFVIPLPYTFDYSSMWKEIFGERIHGIGFCGVILGLTVPSMFYGQHGITNHVCQLKGVLQW